MSVKGRALLAGLLLNASAAAADVCSTGEDCPCTPPPKAEPGRQTLHLGQYHGVAGLYNVWGGPGKRSGLRLQCPQTGPCVCALPDDFQIANIAPENSPYRLVFTGSGSFPPFPDPSVNIGATATGDLVVDSRSYMWNYLHPVGRRLYLDPKVLRTLHVHSNNSALYWGIERWETLGQVKAADADVTVVAGVPYFFMTGGSASGGAAVIVDWAGHVSLARVFGPIAANPQARGRIDIGP